MKNSETSSVITSPTCGGTIFFDHVPKWFCISLVALLKEIVADFPLVVSFGEKIMGYLVHGLEGLTSGREANMVTYPHFFSFSLDATERPTYYRSPLMARVALVKCGDKNYGRRGHTLRSIT